MTTKEAFTEEERMRVCRAPFVAGMAITIADPGTVDAERCLATLVIRIGGLPPRPRVHRLCLPERPHHQQATGTRARTLLAPGGEGRLSTMPLASLDTDGSARRSRSTQRSPRTIWVSARRGIGSHGHRQP